MQKFSEKCAECNQFFKFITSFPFHWYFRNTVTLLPTVVSADLCVYQDGLVHWPVCNLAAGP